MGLGEQDIRKGVMMDLFDEARSLLKDFKGDSYVYGVGSLSKVGSICARIGNSAVLVRDTFPGSDRFVSGIGDCLAENGVGVAGEVEGAGPNCPREDLFRITERIKTLDPDLIISFGGGSTIDAGKAADVLRILGGDIEEYFGSDKVTDKLQRSGKTLSPHVAIQTAASSGAHLTKYSNITDVKSGQKKLIVDNGIVPSNPLFDYEVTYKAPKGLTADGALDGIAHSLEVLYSSVGKETYRITREIARVCISLVVTYLPRVMDDPSDRQARDALCLATDLGGYAIMVGGTNGGHLTSFSLVDILSHGRSCAIMNPYYTVFFAPAIEEALLLVGGIYRDAGYTAADIEKLKGRELGVTVAEAMFALAEKIGFPTGLGDVAGFSEAHIERALTAAKNPQLKMKLQNMPIPLTAEMIDDYMAPILEAARDGDLSKIVNIG
jgi:alcohol dehydrogenase